MLFRYLAAVVVLPAAMAASNAAVVLSNTRIVLDEGRGEATAQARNVGEQPVLLQFWIDDGDAAAGPQHAVSPFILTPPVTRVDAHKGQSIRIIKAGDVANRQQESLFWFNVLEIPPKPAQQLAAGDNLLQLSFRTRIKLFYRPVGLPGTADQAHEQLCFSYDAATGQLAVRNPSPYHITFRKLALRASGDGPVIAELGKTAERMVEPGSERAFPLPPKRTPSPEMVIAYSVINDYGGDTPGQRSSKAPCQP